MIAVVPRCGAPNYNHDFRRDDDIDEHQRYLLTPSVYRLGAHTRDENWEKLIFSVANCGYYIPHVLLAHTKDFPLVHLLYKALPQRCQFRNFSNVALQYMDKHKQCAVFFKNVLLWSLTGLHYAHAKRGLGLRRRLQLYHAFVVKRVDFKAFFTQNVRLLFFVVKEFFVHLVNMQPGLRDALCAMHNWDRYETEITHVMNKIRCIFHNEDNDPWTTMTTLITKYIPRQIKCMRPKTVPYRRQLVEFMWRALDDVEGRGRSLADYAERERQLAFKLSFHDDWAVIAYDRPVGTKKSLSNYHELWGAAVARMGAETKALVAEWCSCARVVSEVYLTKLPPHTAEAQRRVLRVRHDLEPGEDVAAVGRYYVCIQCQSFRGFVPSGTRTNCYAYGHRGLAYDYVSGEVNCASTSHRRKKSAEHPCILVELVGSVLTIFGEKYTICCGCGSTCKFGVVKGYKGQVLCGYCGDDGASDNRRVCAYCMRKNNKHARFDCYDDVSKPQKWKSIWLCNAHRRNVRQDLPVLKSALLL